MSIEGLASLQICEVAQQYNIDLIVMGTTGTSTLKRLLMGSTANYVVKNAPCMLMVVPPKAKFAGLRKIVYATDLSPDNLKNSKHIFPLAEQFNSKLIFLYINDHIFDAVSSENIDKAINKNVTFPNMIGYMQTELFVPDGINSFLNNHRADCLVMFKYHHNFFYQIFNRGTIKEMLLHTTLPLIIIHEKILQKGTRKQLKDKEEVLVPEVI